MPQPPVRIVKERRATFAQTPAAAAGRPGAGTPWANLHLAGDWTATGLPATIEGAVRSGEQAAAARGERARLDRRGGQGLAAGVVIRIGVVMGLQAEAGCLRQPLDDGTLTYVSGGSALRARIGAEQLRAKGIDGLVSFGLAIGLAPVLRPGDLVVGDSVVLPTGKTIATDPAWRAAVLRRLGAAGLSPRVVRIAGSDEPLTSAGAKRRAFQTTVRGGARYREPCGRRGRGRGRPAAAGGPRGRRAGRDHAAGDRLRGDHRGRAARGALRWSPACCGGHGRSGPPGTSRRTAGWRSTRSGGSRRSVPRRSRSARPEFGRAAP